MLFKKLFTFFVLIIFICSTLLNPAMAFEEKDRMDAQRAEVMKLENSQEITDVIENTIRDISEDIPESSEGVGGSSETPEEPSFGLMAFNYTSVSVSGNVTGENSAAIGISSEIVLSTTFFNNSVVDDACNITPTDGVNTTTSGTIKGAYTLGTGLNIDNDDDSCNLVLVAYATGSFYKGYYLPGELIITIDNTTTTYNNQNIVLPLNTTNSFSYTGINVSGYATRPDMTTAVDNANVVLGTANYTPKTIPDNLCTLVPSNQTTTTTNASGYFILGNNLQVISGNDTCNLILTISKDGFVTNESIIEIDSTTQTYPNEDRTLWMYANLTAAIATDLPNEPNTSYDQEYNAVVNVTNLGDVAANNIIVGLNTSNSTPLYNTTNIASVLGTSTQTVTLPVKAPNYTTTDLLVATVTGTDAVNNATLTATDSILINTMQGAGGDDASLVVDVTTNMTWPAVLNATDEAMLVNITVYNDGEATAVNTIPDFVIKNDNGTDYTSYFNMTGPAPASFNLTGGNNQSYTYTVWTHSAPTGNYTIFADASATDINDLSNITSNEANTTFYVSFFAPEITITSPAGGSLTGPSALLSANTSYNTYECYHAENSTDINQLMNQNPITNQTYNATMKGLANGTHTHYVKCIDQWGHENQTSVTWNVDAIGPEIVLNSPLNTSVIKNGTLINFTLTDGISNVSSAVWNWNGTNTTTTFTDTNQSEELILDTSSWSGNVTLKIWALDSWNNINNVIQISGTNNTTGEINITVDNIPPNVTINTPITNNWYGKTIPVNVTAVDDIEVSTVQARWENATNASIFGNWSTLTLTTVNNTSYWIGTVNAPHTTEANWTANNYNLTLRANATDSSGNYNDSETVTFRIDQTPPVVNITAYPTGIIPQVTLFGITANITDVGAGIDPNATCDVYVSTKWIGNISYNSTTGQCDGMVMQGGIGGATNLTVSINDIVGNQGNGTVSVQFEEPPYIPGGNGGGGGGRGTNETPDKLDLEFTIEPATAELISDEEVSFTFEIENTGEAALHNIVIITYDIAQDDYHTDPTGITLMPGESGILELIMTPLSLDTGIYRIDVRVGNDLYSEGGKITLDVTNATEYRAKENAEKACVDAQDNLDTLRSQGYDTRANQDTLDQALVFIKEGNYIGALLTCNAIAGLTADGGNLTTINPFTGFFINTAGPFIAGNLFWLLIAAGIVLGTYLGRNKIVGFIKNKKKKTNGKGKVATAEAAIKEKVIPATKTPEAPKKIETPKPVEKKPETPKKDDKWQIEWR